MQKSHAQHASAADKSIFYANSDLGSSTFRAASWSEAVAKVAEHVAAIDYEIDARGMQRISYTIYKIPANIQDATRVEEEET